MRHLMYFCFSAGVMTTSSLFSRVCDTETKLFLSCPTFLMTDSQWVMPFLSSTSFSKLDHFSSTPVCYMRITMPHNRFTVLPCGRQVGPSPAIGRVAHVGLGWESKGPKPVLMRWPERVLPWRPAFLGHISKQNSNLLCHNCPTHLSHSHTLKPHPL